MSYHYQTGQYQHGQHGNHDPNNPYTQQQDPNGAQQGQYGGAAQYPGQRTDGGQRQDTYSSGYTSPGQATFGAQSQDTSQQSYQYNPQHYAHSPVAQTPIQQYNPQNYANQGQGLQNRPYHPQQYSPAGAHPDAYAQIGATSGPMDPYGYGGSPYSPQVPAYTQSPPVGSYSPAPQASPPPPGRQPGYHSQYSPPPQHQWGNYQPPSHAPSEPQSIPYPSDTYRPSSQRASSVRQPAQQGFGISPSLSGNLDDWQPSPPAHQPDSRQSPSTLYPTDSYGSLPSPPSTGPTPPAHGGPARSNTLDRHPQSRPLPGPPNPRAQHDYFDNQQAQDELFQQVEDAIMGAGQNGPRSPSISVSQAPFDANRSASYAPNSPGLQRNGSVVNGHLSPAPPQEQYSSDSDAEAAAGLEMLRMAEEDDRRRASVGSQMHRFSSGYGSQRSSRHQHLAPPQEESDSDNYGAVDMSSFGGGYDVHMTYGGDPSVLAAGGDINGYDNYNQSMSQHSSMRRSHASQSSHTSRGDHDYHMDSIHPFPPFNTAARVDAGGTGGLSEPTADGRRQSYDEGDEYTFNDALPERFPDEPPDIFYQPSRDSHRPLPAVPDQQSPPYLQTDFRQSPYPGGYGDYAGYTQSQYVPRSTSLVSHTTTPHVAQPSRSKTDAEERKLRQQRASQYGTHESTPATLTPAIDLPTLSGKRFIPSQLGAPSFKKCDEPWSLMSLLKWLLQITNPDQVTELREAEVKEALVALFTNKVPTMNITDAEVLSNRVVLDMYEAETLVKTEEWVKIVPGPMQGVIFQLTASGCYAPTLHNHIIPGRCYSHHCQRTLKKVNLRDQPSRSGESWADFYKLKKEDCDGKPKHDLERQNILHEIVQTEERYMEQLNVLRTLFKDPLANANPSIIAPKRKEDFVAKVFGKADAVRQANEDHLLPQLKYRQQEQGPWIKGFSDIFRQWIRKAKAAYIDYAGSFPGATFLIRQEIERNIDFRNFMDRARNDKRSQRLDWSTYLKSPITRLQRYSLLLNTVLKTMKVDSEEKVNLKLACEEVKAVTLECDARVDDMQRKVDLNELARKLVLRPGMKNEVNLNLEEYGRQVIYRGDIQRMGGNRFTWLDSHGILFDHYFVLAKTVTQRTEQSGKSDIYDVSRLPIPMDLLILESANDPPVQKSSYVKGITSLRDVPAGRSSTPLDNSGISRVASNTSVAPTLNTVNTGSSGTSLATVTSLGDGKEAEKILYPFKVKHLGRETYTLFAPSDKARKDWAESIVKAKTKHAASLFNQNAEPFKLRVMADSAFVYDGFAGTGGRAAVIKGTPVDRAIKEVEQRFKDTGRPAPICRVRVNCATSFTTSGENAREMVAVGTDIGVFISETNNPRGWIKSIGMQRVTQIAVLEEFNLFLLIADKALISYQLDVVCPNTANGPIVNNDNATKAPKKLSGSKDIGFFVHGRMKDRTLVFYKKRENISSVFKVIEPIYQKSSEKKRGMFKRGNTDFFREFDEFYIPAECSGVNLFHSSLAVATARGFEVLTLDKKQPVTVPDLKAPEVQNIAANIKDQRAIAMLRISDQEFLLVFATCGVYVNKHGDVSRSVLMNFVGNVQNAALYGAYLILFDNDFVEVRNALNGRLKQSIPGREIKCLDDGGSWSSAGPAGANGTAAGGTRINGRTVKLVMQHPEAERTQIVAELLLNENMKEQ